MKFEWDKSKALSNLQKHRVSFEEAATIFGDPRAVTIPDLDHSDGEPREVTIGLSCNMIITVVSHTDRHGRIRIISARRATKKEQRVYLEDKI
ncbi:MAG: BrnT family toxin [Oligoflexia bacterium]|nr:BrnT family toxin [Oligoflexia bacterium]